MAIASLSPYSGWSRLLPGDASRGSAPRLENKNPLNWAHLPEEASEEGTSLVPAWLTWIGSARLASAVSPLLAWSSIASTRPSSKEARLEDASRYGNPLPQVLETATPYFEVYASIRLSNENVEKKQPSQS